MKKWRRLPEHDLPGSAPIFSRVHPCDSWLPYFEAERPSLFPSLPWCKPPTSGFSIIFSNSGTNRFEPGDFDKLALL